MPRSKSPARGRKKSSARAAAASSGAPNLDDANVQLGVTVGVMLAYLIVVKGTPIDKNIVGAFFNTGASEHHVAHWPWGLILTGHVFNNCQGQKAGFWLGGLWNSMCACFAGYFVLDFLSCSPWRLLADESLATLVLLAWYICNHDLPFTGINVWSIITGSPVGGLLQFWMSGCSKVFTANLILEAVNGASSTPGALGFSLVAPAITAVMVGSASNFWPISQNPAAGFKNCSGAAEHALNIAMFTILLPVVLGLLPALGAVYNPINAFLGGNMVVACVVADHLFGQHIPISPCAEVSKILTKVLNL